MNLTPPVAIGAAWVAWFISWLTAAAWTRRTVERASYAREFPNRLVTVVGALLLFGSLSGRSLTPWAWHVDDAIAWALFGCVLAGMAFAWWARLHLGTLWSGTVTRKANHHIVDTGPYGFVRHPIYTGMLFSLYATAAQRGSMDALMGVVLITIGLWMKARLEESFLAQDLTDYARYRARVPMLVPGLRGWS
jgi:protein-S-isoprenylcysteine O-methyltransferase Ste14